MQIRQLIAATLVAGLFASSASASITYLFDQEISGDGEGSSSTINITGTITVADLGIVELADITDYSLSFTSSTYPGPTVLTPSNSLLEVDGSLLSATATELLFDINAGLNGEFRILGTTEIVNDFVRFAISNDGSEGSQVFALHTPNYAPPFDDPQDAAGFDPGDSGTYTLAVIPEPTSLALLGLGGLALLRRRVMRS
jgi:hypothetical protein